MALGFCDSRTLDKPCPDGILWPVGGMPFIFFRAPYPIFDPLFFLAFYYCIWLC